MSSNPSPLRGVAVLAVVVALVLWPIIGFVGAIDPAVAQAGNHDTDDSSQGPPEAAFASFPVGGAVGETLRVAAATDGRIVTYDVDWGDGTSEEIPTEGTHVYDSAGTYDVTLTVTDDQGRTDSVTQTLTVDNASDRRVTAVDSSRPGTVDEDDPTTGDGHRYEPVVFEGSAGQLVTVATDTASSVRLSVRRTDDGRDEVVRSPTDAVRHPSHTRVELPADGEYTVRVTAGDRDDLPVEYELAVTELAVAPGDASAPTTDDLRPLDPNTEVESDFGEDDRRDRFGSLVESDSFEGAAGDQTTITYEYETDQVATPLVTVSGPDLQAFPASGEEITLPGNGTYSVVVSGPDPRFSDDLPRAYTLALNRTRESDADRLVVDADGAVGEYTSIEAATDAAQSGATVEVRPGTYREQVTITTNITLVAPDGATVRGDGSGAGVTIGEIEGSDTRPVVDGFTVSGFETGIDGTGQTFGITPQDWRLRNTTVVDNTEMGVRGSAGDWRLENVTIADNGRIGVDGFVASDNWTVSNATIRGHSEDGIRGDDGSWEIRDTSLVNNGNGISALEANGDWTLRNVTISDSAGLGVQAQRTEGDWLVVNSTIVESGGQAGIDALSSTADWRVEESRIVNNTDSGIMAASTAGNWTIRGSTVSENGDGDAEVSVGIEARASTGDWRVVDTSVTDNDFEGIDAETAAGNWSVLRSSVGDNRYSGIGARRTSGDWVVRNTVLTGNGDPQTGNLVNSYGIAANRSTGDWTVERSRLARNENSGIPAPATEGDWTVERTVFGGVRAVDTSGEWRIRRSNIVRGTARVNGTDSLFEGDARENWWGQESGPTVDQCVGNVDCGAALSDPANAGPDISPVSFSVNPQQPVVNSSVEFDATSSPDNASITGYEWTVGDGTATEGAVVKHTYNRTGEFTVELDATFADGSTQSVTETVTVTSNETLVVDVTGETGNFTAIQPAVDNASDTARVEVRPGRYDESVTVDKNVSIVAPSGAEITAGISERSGLDSAQGASFRIPAGSRAAPAVVNFTADGNGPGTVLEAVDTRGDWTVRNLTAEDATAVDAKRSTGDWSVSESTVDGIGTGIVATEAAGSWSVEDTTLEAVAIDASATTGAWRLGNVTVTDAAGTGVVAVDASGNWSISNATLVNASDAGVDASDTTGDWRIGGVTEIRDSATAVEAVGTDGAWRVHRTNFVGNDREVDAASAGQRGNARRNWWGEPWTVDDRQCRGNVTCENPLGEPASPDATGIEARVLNASGAAENAEPTPQPGADVYLYDSPDSPVDPAGGPTVERRALRLEGQELVFDEGFLERAALNVTAGPDGVVRYTGLDASDHCILVDPPRSSPANVSVSCVAVGAETVSDERVTFTNETHLEYLDGPSETLESRSKQEIQERIFAGKSVFPNTSDALDEELLVNENAGYYKDISASIQCAAGIVDPASIPPLPGLGDDGRLVTCDQLPQDRGDIAQFIADKSLDVLTDFDTEHYARWALSSVEADNNGRIARYAANLSQVQWARQPARTEFNEVDYDSLPTVRNSRSGVEAAHRDLDRLRRGDRPGGENTRPPEDLNHRHVRKVFEQQRTAFSDDGIAPGLVITPTGEVVLYQRAEGHIEVNDNAYLAVERADRAKAWAVYYQEVGDVLATVPHPVAQTAGSIIWGTARAAEAGVDVFRASEKQRVADSFAKTQIYTLYDVESVERINRNSVEWLERQYEDPVTGRVDGEITNGPAFPSDENGINVVTATQPEEPKRSSLRTRATGEMTVAAANTGEATVNTRLVGVGRFQSNYGFDPRSGEEPIEPHVQPSVAPNVSESPVRLGPGETVSKTLRYSLDNPKTEPYRFHVFLSVLLMDGRQVDVASDWTFVDIKDRRQAGDCTENRGFCGADGPGYEIRDIENLDTAVPDETLESSGGISGRVDPNTDQQRMHTRSFVYTTADTAQGRAMSEQTFESNRQSVGTVLDTDVEPGDDVTRQLSITDDTASTTMLLVAPPASGTSLRVQDEAGNTVGYRPQTGEGVVERPGASYTGSEQAIERVVLGDAAGENLTVTATTTDADEAVSVEVLVVETPQRPAMMGLVPGVIRTTVDPGETADPTFRIAEVGGQQPIQNVAVSHTGLANGAGTQLPEESLSIEPGTIDRINATETRPLNATVRVPSNISIADDDPTEFTGAVTVETGTAGEDTVPISVLLLDSSVANASLFEAERSVTGVHLDRTEVEAAGPDPPGRAKAVYQFTVLGEGNATVVVDSASENTEPLHLEDGEWVPARSSRVGDRMFIEASAGTETVALVDSSGSDTTDPDGDDSDRDSDDTSDGTPTATTSPTPVTTTASPTQTPTRTATGTATRSTTETVAPTTEPPTETVAPTTGPPTETVAPTTGPLTETPEVTAPAPTAELDPGDETTGAPSTAVGFVPLALLATAAVAAVAILLLRRRSR